MAVAAKTKKRTGGKKNAFSPFVDDSGKKVLLFASVERFSVSRMWDFLFGMDVSDGVLEVSDGIRDLSKGKADLPF